MNRAGDLWAAGPKHVAVVPYGTKRFVDRSIPGSDQDIEFGRGLLLEDSQGRMLAPASVGVARWTGTAWQLIGQANGLKNMSNIVGMAFDEAGDLALAIRGDGLYQWDGYKDWEGWDNKQGLPSALIWAIAFSNTGRVFVGTDRGPAWIDPVNGSAGPLLTRHPWGFGHVSGMGFNFDGSLWGATHSGAILHIDSKTGAAEQTARVSASIYAAFQDPAGRVFFLTRQGIKMREAMDVKATPRSIPAANALLGNSAIVQSGCGSPDGADWFVGDNRIVRFKDGQWTAPPIDGLNMPRGTLLGLFCAQDGSIWATGDQTGTWQLTPANGRMKAWKLDPPAELRSLASLTVLKDRRGWLWLGTDMGLLVWNGNAWRHLTQESGLIWNDTDQGVLQEAPDGSLWIGTSGGVSHLLHPELVFDASPLPVSITAIRRGQQDLTGLQKIVLPWAGQQQPLRFQISSPVARDRSELVFKYRMDGLQTDWIESQHGTALFSSLTPGTYVFTAIASNPGLGAESSPVKVQVVILPPWWRTNWFYFLCAVVLILVAVVTDRLRAEHLEAKSRELEKIIRERTSELELRPRTAAHPGDARRAHRNAESSRNPAPAGN